MTDDDITDIIIGQAIRIHRLLGPGLFEQVYESALAISLEKQGLGVARQVVLPIEFEGVTLDVAYRLDMLIEDRVILEIKAQEKSHPVHARQLLTYLRLKKRRVGLVLNFGKERLLDGVERVVNGYT
ncbi:MAG: GxxExxY protein [Gemmatimonadaceae bacterium]|jgi:GxxExxY protein|uniref:GxxExxY protein n=1 Tax=Gemmatimonas sp. TaxID=1962908 RepID=UPI001DF01F27|nr:GxxExxY protein [Gemmatimonas sp.]NCW44129.1 GxxExxY protein [Gemmatimonadaceae bacterium]